jgi:hypothetical protein
MGETIDTDADDVILSADAKEHRERKATKSDDARVPTELWLDHLIEDGNDLPEVRSWTTAEISALPTVLDFFRERALRRWVLNVTRSFGRWIRRKEAIDCERSAATDGSIQWNGSKYAWKERNQYLGWWARRQDNRGADVDAAYDAILRALKSTWWSWEDGSRPFHWRWPEDYQVRIRDGIPVYFVTPPPDLP